MRRIERKGNFVMLAAYRFYDESLEGRAHTLTWMSFWRFFQKMKNCLQVLETTGLGRL
ncbi:MULTISPECIES: hypothetical protein [Pseudomonas]|uniref:hypothetical protein n=1 Tax=Pseudomonas TaxID=286 RepID=UPI0003DFE619|nr:MULTISPECIES: hypothetical protein [Pseudomonas]AHF65604.1 hypothetical protein PCH70_04510 [Pseudomonas cichorii JBC1]QVE17609.1 hypothetical protein KGD89_02190 [Pseudomonas cichorii]SDN93245.1 hypothetical protein SAMN05216599_104219 [Pseudomonas cichorii]